jgi:hypothetical protein
MGTHWATLLGQLTALAAVVALSPFSVIPAIALVMHSDRARVTGGAFIAGWLAGKAAITAAFIGVPRLLHDWLDRPAPSWLPWLQIAGGAMFVLGGLWYRRQHRPPRGLPRASAEEMAVATAAGTPRWLARLKHITPATAAAVGVTLTLINPKVLAACAAAGIAIGSAASTPLGAAAAVTYFALLAGSTAAVPILAYAVWSHRVDRTLERFKSWLASRQVVLTTGLLVVLGLALLGAGLRGLL